MIEGLSQIGHYFRPIYANSKGAYRISKQGPIIRENVNRHNWIFAYNSSTNSNIGNIIITFDGKRYPYL